LYKALGLSVGTVIEGMDNEARRKAYACDITYCTNKQVAFDYLRDRLTMGRHASRRQLEVERLHSDNARIDRLLLRGLCFAIVDEADSVLIDEARTPLIISRTSDNPLEAQTYHQALQLAEQLHEGVDFTIRQQDRVILLTEPGKTRLASLCQPLKGVWTGQRRREYLVKQALSALHLFVRDKHYLCRDGKAQIIDEKYRPGDGRSFLGARVTSTDRNQGRAGTIEQQGNPGTDQLSALFPALLKVGRHEWDGPGSGGGTGWRVRAAGGASPATSTFAEKHTSRLGVYNSGEEMGRSH